MTNMNYSTWIIIEQIPKNVIIKKKNHIFIWMWVKTKGMYAWTNQYIYIYILHNPFRHFYSSQSTFGIFYLSGEVFHKKSGIISDLLNIPMIYIF